MSLKYISILFLIAQSCALNTYESIPGPKENSDLDFIWFTYIDTYLNYANKYGDLVRYSLTAGDFVLLSSAELMDYAYNGPNATKYFGRMSNDFFMYSYGTVTGNKSLSAAITNAYGKDQLIRRKIFFDEIAPNFHTLLPALNKYAKDLVETFKKNAGNEKYEPYADVRNNVFEVMTHMIWGDYIDNNLDRKRALREGAHYWIDEFAYFVPFSYPYSFLLGYKEYWMTYYMTEFNYFQEDLINLVRNNTINDNSWFSTYAKAKVEGELLSKEAVKAICYEFLEANFGPMPTLVTYGLYLLGNNRTALNLLYDEIKDIEGDITIQHIHKKPILTWVVKEITRIYPPGGAINVRMTTDDDSLNGYAVPPKVNIATNTYRVQNDARYWNEPQVFNPWRWEQPIVPGSYSPWGLGGKSCPGRDFAIYQATVTMAHIIKNFDIHYTASQPPVMGFSCIAFFRTPVQVKLVPRDITMSTSSKEEL